MIGAAQILQSFRERTSKWRKEMLEEDDARSIDQLQQCVHSESIPTCASL